MLIGRCFRSITERLSITRTQRDSKYGHEYPGQYGRVRARRKKRVVFAGASIRITTRCSNSVVAQARSPSLSFPLSLSRGLVPYCASLLFTDSWFCLVMYWTLKLWMTSSLCFHCLPTQYLLCCENAAGQAWQDI